MHNNISQQSRYPLKGLIDAQWQDIHECDRLIEILEASKPGTKQLQRLIDSFKENLDLHRFLSKESIASNVRTEAELSRWEEVA